MQLEWTKINDSFPFSYLLSFLRFYLNYTNSFFKSYEPINLNFVFSDQTSDELSRPEFQRCPSFLTNSVDSYRSKEAHRILGFRFQAIFATIEGRRSNKWWPELVLCETRKKKVKIYLWSPNFGFFLLMLEFPKVTDAVRNL
ncbi:hypothetical protein LINGRAHAP2_LOCUS36266 [Linum grandiflorum]